jgi:hypothetical protein
MKKIYDSLSKVLKDNKVIAEVGQPQEQRSIPEQRSIAKVVEEETKNVPNELKCSFE